MNILFTSDQYTPAVNGVVTHVKFIREELERRGHTVYILTAKRKGSKKEKNVFFAPSIPFLLRPIDPIIVPFTPNTMKEIDNIQFDIIHNHFFTTGIVGMKLAKERNVPIMATLHLTYKTYFDWILPHISRFFYPLADKIAREYLNRHDFVAAPSGKGKKELEKIGVKTPVEVIHNGIYLPNMHDTNSTHFMEKHGIKKDTPVVIVAGRIDRGKNFDLAVEAFSIVKKAIPDAKLLIAGDGPERPTIEKLVAEKGLTDSVIFTGMLDKKGVYEAYKSSTLMLFASDSDMLPTVIIEAFSFALPVVSIREDAPLELVKDNKNGIVCSKNATSLADGIIEVLRNPSKLKRLSEDALASSKLYSLERNVDNLLKKYEELIKTKSRG